MAYFYQQKHFLDKFIKLIKDCHQIILDRYDCDFEIIFKDNHNCVSEIINLCNQHISHLIQQLKINYSGIISETNKNDSYEIRKKLRWTWLVEPLNGKKEFLEKNGQFSVNIGLCDFGIPVFGIVGFPLTGEIYFGIKEVGSFKMIQNSIFRLAITPKDMFVSGVRIISSLSQESKENHKHIQNFREPTIINVESSLRLLWIVENKADIYFHRGVSCEWEICAFHAIIKYAGGHLLVDGYSNELSYNKENSLNSNFVVH